MFISRQTLDALQDQGVKFGMKLESLESNCQASGLDLHSDIIELRMKMDDLRKDIKSIATAAGLEYKAAPEWIKKV